MGILAGAADASAGSGRAGFVGGGFAGGGFGRGGVVAGLRPGRFAGKGGFVGGSRFRHGAVHGFRRDLFGGGVAGFGPGFRGPNGFLGSCGGIGFGAGCPGGFGSGFGYGLGYAGYGLGYGYGYGGSGPVNTTIVNIDGGSGGVAGIRPPPVQPPAIYVIGNGRRSAARGRSNVVRLLGAAPGPVGASSALADAESGVVGAGGPRIIRLSGR